MDPYPLATLRSQRRRRGFHYPTYTTPTGPSRLSYASAPLTRGTYPTSPTLQHLPCSPPALHAHPACAYGRANVAAYPAGPARQGAATYPVRGLPSTAAREIETKIEDVSCPIQVLPTLRDQAPARRGGVPILYVAYPIRGLP